MSLLALATSREVANQLYPRPAGGRSFMRNTKQARGRTPAHTTSRCPISSTNSDPFLVPEVPPSLSIFHSNNSSRTCNTATNNLINTFGPHCHNDTTNTLHNLKRGGSRCLGQADLVCPDVSSDVCSHVNRDWLTRQFHPPDQPQG